MFKNQESIFGCIFNADDSPAKRPQDLPLSGKEKPDETPQADTKTEDAEEICK